MKISRSAIIIVSTILLLIIAGFAIQSNVTGPPILVADVTVSDGNATIVDTNATIIASVATVTNTNATIVASTASIADTNATIAITAAITDTNPTFTDIIKIVESLASATAEAVALEAARLEEEAAQKAAKEKAAKEKAAKEKAAKAKAAKEKAAKEKAQQGKPIQAKPGPQGQAPVAIAPTKPTVRGNAPSDVVNKLVQFGTKRVSLINRSIRPSSGSRKVVREGDMYVGRYYYVEPNSLSVEATPAAANSPFKYVGKVRYRECFYEITATSREEAMSGQGKIVKQRNMCEIIQYRNNRWLE